MVPSDEELVRVQQRFQPVELRLDLGERAGLGEVDSCVLRKGRQSLKRVMRGG